jgi:regulatory protein
MNKQLLSKAMKYCAYQERCHEEVRTKLIEIGARGAELEQIMAKLIEDNFLNEERFAIAYAGGKFRQKKWGWNKIRQELQLRKISDYCIKKAYEEIQGKQYKMSLLEVVYKKRKLTSEKRLPILKKKIADYCIQRGYEPEMVWDMVNAEIII